MTDPYIPRTQKGLFGNATVWVFAILALVLAVSAVVFGVRWITAPVKGKLAAREQIQSGSFRIAAYNHFFDLCAAVQADETRLDAQYAEYAVAGESDLDRIRANIAGIASDRAEAIFQYNADARKSYTIGQFRSRGLPYQIPVGPYSKEAPTSCTAS